jgi:hypothetical protein
MWLGGGLRRARGREERGKREEVARAARTVGYEREDFGEQTLLNARFLVGCRVRTGSPRWLLYDLANMMDSGNKNWYLVTYELGVEFGQPRLALAVED